MKKIVTFLVLVSLLLSLCSCNVKVSENLFAMDTVMSFFLEGKNSRECITEIKEEIKNLESLFSVTDKSSEISKINAFNQVSVSKTTSDIISRSLQISEMTDGYFDITVYPILELWGFTKDSYKIPSDTEISSVLKSVNYKNVNVSNQNIGFEGKIDLGGIAKGYTCDKIFEILNKHSIDEAIISLGGNILIKGDIKNVGIQHPLSSEEVICTLKEQNTSIVTSGGYQRFFEKDGKVYHHIIDPKTGYPANNGIISATIICKDSTLADAISTAVYVMGIEKAIQLWRSENNFDMILITENEIYSTADITVCDSSYKLNTIE